MAVETRWTPEVVDAFLKRLILDIYFEFVWPNRTRDYAAWEAGMFVMNRIPTE
jgi:hypothetical protein